MSERTCPRCGDQRHSNSLSEWCVRCGWARNFTPPLIDPNRLLQVMAGALVQSPATCRLLQHMGVLEPAPWRSPEGEQPA